MDCLLKADDANKCLSLCKPSLISSFSLEQDNVRSSEGPKLPDEGNLPLLDNLPLELDQKGTEFIYFINTGTGATHETRAVRWTDTRLFKHS